ILIVLFINPVVMPFVESFITGVGVYWRVLWLLQITVVVAAGMTELADRWSFSLVKALLVIFCCVVLFVSGRSIFRDEDVKVSANPYKISETTKAMADVIEETSDKPLKDVTIILPRVLSSELRQYKDICQVYYPYVSNNYMEYQTKAEYKKMMALYNELYNYQSFKVADLTETTKLLDLDYVAMYSEAAARQEKAIPRNFEKCYDDGLYCLYKVK
ncbi:MAG: hypothetical protein HUJ75_01970, partial [Parasporobacterium sp.]|nr:hypothetical protein [Parasporobacterium sp.]